MGTFGGSVNCKYQSSFLWQSSLATGLVPAINTFDAQISYVFARPNQNRVGVPIVPLSIKIGGTNLLNRAYTTFDAGPSVGGLYYATVVLKFLN